MGCSKVEQEAYRHKISLIHGLMIIYGFSYEEARKAVSCEKVSNFLFDNLESKAIGHLKKESVQVKYAISNEVDPADLADKLANLSY